MMAQATTLPDPDLVQNWKHRIDGWDLEASGEHIEEKEAVVLVNGKPTEFRDVKDGPAIYIGRENAHYGLDRHPMANPAPVSEYGRKDSLLEFTDVLVGAVEESEEMQDAVMSLYGQPLACWCLPKLCHGHVLNLYLVYRLHAGMDPREAGDHITKRIQSEIDRRIANGTANPADYY